MNVEQIKTAIVELSPDELAQLAEWFEEFCSEAWDRQIEDGVEAGRDMGKCDIPTDIRILAILDMGLMFSAMIRKFSSGSKEKLRVRIHDSIKRLWEAESLEAFTDWHSSFCSWGISNIRQTDVNPASYGQIAKTLNVVLKVAIYYSHLPNYEVSARLSPWLDAAVDNKMMRMLKRCYPNPNVFNDNWPASLKDVNNVEKYSAIQGLVRRFISEKHPGITPVQFDDLYWWQLNR